MVQFLVFLIDTSIWYSVWSAVVGTLVGFNEHLGDIRTFKDIRDNFVKAPEAFCSKLLHSETAKVYPSSRNLAGGMNEPTEVSEASELTTRRWRGYA